MKAQTFLFCFVMALAVSAYAADPTPSGKFKGVVRDPEGAVIANATVFVHCDWSGTDAKPGETAGPKQDLFLTTSKMGEFSVDLAPGFYDVAIFAHGFSPNAGKVRIKTSQTTNYGATLPPDPQMTAEFGDTFSDASGHKQ